MKRVEGRRGRWCSWERREGNDENVFEK